MNAKHRLSKHYPGECSKIASCHQILAFRKGLPGPGQSTIASSVGAWHAPPADGSSTEPHSPDVVGAAFAIMALQGALQSLRSVALSRISIPVSSLQASVRAGAVTFLRGFAESTYIDKNVVTDRVINVVKNFDKVDPAKVGASIQAHLSL